MIGPATAPKGGPTPAAGSYMERGCGSRHLVPAALVLPSQISGLSEDQDIKVRSLNARLRGTSRLNLPICGPHMGLMGDW